MALQRFRQVSDCALLVLLVLLVCMELLAWRSEALTLVNCPTGCNCNNDKFVECEEKSIDVLPIALSPSVQRLVFRNNKIKTVTLQFYTELLHLDLCAISSPIYRQGASNINKNYRSSASTTTKYSRFLTRRSMDWTR